MSFASNNGGAPGPSGSGAPPVRLLSFAAAALLAVGGAAGCSQPAGSAAASPSVSAGRVAIAAADRSACAQLLFRLQQVTVVISASSELIASSLDRQQLSQRIADEATQLRRAADLMAQGPVPAALVKADQDLVAALRTFAGDFDRANDAAVRGDLSAAVTAMRDDAALQRIVGASQTIENSCQRG